MNTWYNVWQAHRCAVTCAKSHTSPRLSAKGQYTCRTVTQPGSSVCAVECECWLLLLCQPQKASATFGTFGSVDIPTATAPDAWAVRAECQMPPTSPSITASSFTARPTSGTSFLRPCPLHADAHTSTPPPQHCSRTAPHPQPQQTQPAAAVPHTTTAPAAPCLP